MKVDRNLNLVIPVYRSDGVTIHVHVAPLSRAAFDQNFLIIAKTFAALHAQGLGALAGPRIAAKMLRTIAKETNDTTVETGLFAEIHRLTNVVAPGPSGWLTLPIDVAAAQKMIDPDDVEEVENAACFFMLAWAMHRPKEALAIMEVASSLWDAQLTSSNATGFAASLPTSTTAAATGPNPTVAPLSIPS